MTLSTPPAFDPGWPPAPGPISVDQYLAQVDSNRLQLEAQLAQTHSKFAAMETSRLAHEAEVRDDLGALARTAAAEIARLEGEHERAILAMRTAAAEESIAITAAARERAGGSMTHGEAGGR